MTFFEETFSIAANAFAIITSIFACYAWLSYKCGLHSKKVVLENYLKMEKEKSRDNGQRTTLHLMAHLGLTESEILQASFSSKKINRKLVKEKTSNRAKSILFEYKP